MVNIIMRQPWSTAVVHMLHNCEARELRLWSTQPTTVANTKTLYINAISMYC